MAYIKGKQKLYSTNREDFKAFQTIESYEIFDRYKEFAIILNTRISDGYRHFLAQPINDDGTIEWHSKSWKEEPRRLTELVGDTRKNYEKILTDTLSFYHTVINKLRKGNDENKKEAEYLEKAVKFVDDNFVFCYDGLAVLGVWGKKVRDGKRDDIGQYSADAVLNVVTFNPGINGHLKGEPVLRKPKDYKIAETEIPEIEPNEGYIFIGWDVNPKNFTVVRDVEFIALYDVVEHPNENDISEEPTDNQPNIILEDSNINIEDKENKDEKDEPDEETEDHPEFILRPVSGLDPDRGDLSSNTVINEPVVSEPVITPLSPWWKRWYSGGVGGVFVAGGGTDGCLQQLIRWLAIILLLLLLICFVRKCNECLTCYRCQQVLDQTGYLPEDEDWDNIPEDTDPPFDDEDLENLGEIVCLEHLFPPIGNQEQYGTCVAWAVGYNLKTAMNAIDNSWSPEQLASAINQTSPKDLWLLIPENNKRERCRGTTFEPAFRALILAGAASMEQVPYENLGDCTGIETGDINNRFESFSRVPVPDEINLKGYLNAGVPLAFGARLGDRFMRWNSEAVINSDTYNNRGMQHAYHAMVLTGYDDNRNAFRVRNSWGPAWGDQGSIWVDYDFFVNNFCHAAFVARNALGDYVPVPDTDDETNDETNDDSDADDDDDTDDDDDANDDTDTSDDTDEV